MNTKSGETVELMLYGEHINLNSRQEDENKRNTASIKCRPRSALYASNLNVPVYKKRPFSAGNQPTSTSLQTLIRRAHTDRPDIYKPKTTDICRDSFNIPGTVDSTILFNKLLKDPIQNTYQLSKSHREYLDINSKHFVGCDNTSDISSVDTVTSLGTKIKIRAQGLDKFQMNPKKSSAVEEASVKLKSSKGSHSMHYSKTDFRSMDPIIDTENEKSETPTNSKLSIFVPQSKDDNTSSGVSSSSEAQTFVYNQNNSDNSNHGTHKIVRSKRNPQISINWFPDSVGKAQNKQRQDIIETDQKKDLTGIVSFCESTQINNLNSYDDEDYLTDSYKQYNTQLSLVEEESSQDSELSPKLPSQNFNFIEPIKENSKTKNNIIEVKTANRHEKKSENSNSNTVELLKTTKDFESKIKKIKTEDEMEQRFKILENKYKIENDTTNVFNDVSEFNYDNLRRDPYEYNYTPLNGGLKHSWTSLENIVSKENDSHCYERENKSSYKINGTIIEHTKYDHKEHNEEIPEVIEKNVKFIQDSRQTPNNLEINKIHLSLNGVTSIVQDFHSLNNENWRFNAVHTINDTMIPSIQINNRTDNYNMFDQIKNKHSHKETEIISEDFVQDNTEYNTEIGESEKMLNPEYPQYLEKSETKQYTSKVIEEYKKEIATINNVHELTIKDIRSNLVDPNTSSAGNQVPINVIANKNDEDTDNLKLQDIEYNSTKSETKISIKPSQEQTNNNDISNFLSDYSKYKLRNLEIFEEPKLSQLEEVHKIIEDNQEVETKPKMKKKTKRKERGQSYRYKNYNSNESTDSKYTETKKTKHESRRLIKSAPCAKKENNGSAKFRARKIALSKSTTNLNSRMFIDTEKDIVSWMATKVDTTFDETSSGGHNDTPTPDLMNDSNQYNRLYSYHTHENEQIEKKIEPIIKEKHNHISGGSSTSKRSDPQMSQMKSGSIQKSNDIVKTKLKPKEVSFEVDKYSQSVDDNDTINDWIGDDTNETELTEIMDNDNMVTNMYSVFKDIEKNSGPGPSGDSLTKTTAQEIEQEMSVEYRDIANYLEKVESTANEEISSLSHTQPPFTLKVEELMELSKGELAHRAVASALAAGKAGAAAVRLRSALVSAANRAAARIKSERLAARQKANTAAQHASQAIARHQKFIEQLINEKKALAERIEQLVGAVAGAESRSARAAQASTERLQLELRNQRQRLTQAHQRDKQAWLKQHTQKIKEMTVKGLESELQELEEKHSMKLAALQRDMEVKLMAERDKHARELRIQKETAARQLEDELDRERLVAAERMEHKRVEWESALVAAAERAGIEGREAARTARREVEQWKSEQDKVMEERRQQLEAQADKKKATLLEEIAQMKQNMGKEFEKHKEDFGRKQSEAMKEREMEIRALMRRERDREIEKAIDSMEVEAQEGRKEMQESIRRIKTKYEGDMKILEDSEQTALLRCKEAREQLREAQEQCALNQITITQLEGKLRQADELKAQTVTEMEISMRTAEMKLREEMEDLRGQIMNLQLQHKDEMHQLYAKVKLAVSKKDEALTAARRDAATLRDRCIRLEARLAT